MAHTDEELATMECLRHAIEDTQGTIRAYDVKAEILAALLTLIVTVCSQSLFNGLNENGQLALKVSWFLCLVTIIALGAVLMPKSNLFASIKYGTFSPKSTYYLHEINKSPNSTVSDIATRALATNWIQELTYESMKLSLIRDRKYWWFTRALWISFGTLVPILVALLIG